MEIVTYSCHDKAEKWLTWHKTTITICNSSGVCQLFSSGEKLSKVAGHGQNRSKMDRLKGGLDGFSYFSLIFSYFIF
jgi:hypothetical protein